jgi:hypothetical protein
MGQRVLTPDPSEPSALIDPFDPWPIDPLSILLYSHRPAASCLQMNLAWSYSAQDLTSYKRSLKATLDELHVYQQTSLPAIKSCAVKCLPLIAALNYDSNALINACLDSAIYTIPRAACSNVDRRSDVMTGWNECIAHLRDKSILWHDIWVDWGHPRDGAVASIMRRTRASYH